MWASNIIPWVSQSATTLPDISLDLVGLFIIVDLHAIAVRTALRGAASLFDVLVLCPGLHKQHTAQELHHGEHPAVAALTTGYVFRVENPATVFYLQMVSKTAHLTMLSVTMPRTANVERMSTGDKQTTVADPQHAGRTYIWFSHMCYLLCVLNTVFCMAIMIAAGDIYFLTTILPLILARSLNTLALRRRASHVWSGASEPGVQGDLLILLSQDRWVRMRGLVDDLKAVTSGSWLQIATIFESVLATVSTLLTYSAVVLAANVTRMGQATLLWLLTTNLGLLAMANHMTVELNMFGRSVRVESVSRQYGRRLEMAEQLIEETKRDDWAVKLGMIGASQTRYSKVQEEQAIV